MNSAESSQEWLRRWFWRLRYRLYSRDLYGPLREGRGSKENPLTQEDLRPLMLALRRIGLSHE